MPGELGLPTAAFVCIGDEMLAGEVTEENLPHLAKTLITKGIKLDEVRIIADDIDDISLALKTLKQRHNYVFTSGGIGATHDDLTTEAIAGMLGLPIIINEKCRQETEFSLERKLTQAELKTIKLPKTAQPVFSTLSKTPGYVIENIYVLLGSPRVFKSMVNEVCKSIKSGGTIHTLYVHFYAPESEIAADIEAVATKYPKLLIGSYPVFSDNKAHTKVAFRGTSKKQVENATIMLKKAIGKFLCS